MSGAFSFFLRLRLGSFFAKLAGQEPHVSWAALVREHLLEYPVQKLRLLSGTDKRPLPEESVVRADDDFVVIRIDGHNIFWPVDFPHDQIRSCYLSMRDDGPDNYFRFYTPQKDDVVFDLGACEGLFSLMLRGRVAKVYSFEPFPTLCTSLAMTLKEDVEGDRAEICNYAVGDKTGEADFYLDDDLDGSTMAGDRIGGGVKKIIVPSITLDEFVRAKGIEKISMIKMDIEGAEYSALHGARETLARLRPDLLVCTYHYPHDYERISDFLRENGYTLTASPLVMTPQGGGRPWYRHALIYATPAGSGRAS